MLAPFLGLGYHSVTLLRFITYALPLLILLLALFGFAVELLDAEPRPGSVIRLTLFEQPRVPAQLVLGAWLIEASGLLALYLIAQGRCGAWWLDGLVAGWLAWIFRGPLLVLTIVVAARQAHEPWWSLAFGWWVLYTVCGLTLAWLARRTQLTAPPDPGWPERAIAPGGAAVPEPAAPGVADQPTGVEEASPEEEVPSEPEKETPDSAEALPAEIDPAQEPERDALEPEPEAPELDPLEEATPSIDDESGEPRAPDEPSEPGSEHAPNNGSTRDPREG